MGIGEGELFGVNKLLRWANSDILKQANKQTANADEQARKMPLFPTRDATILFGQEWKSSVCSTFAFHIDKHKKRPDIEKEWLTKSVTGRESS